MKKLPLIATAFKPWVMVNVRKGFSPTNYLGLKPGKKRAFVSTTLKVVAIVAPVYGSKNQSLA